MLNKLDCSAEHSRDSIIQKLWENVQQLPKILKEIKPALEAGGNLGELRGMTSADYDSLYALACELCDEDKFKDALAIALQLAIHQPQQARYSFLAASCFHRLGLVQPAVSLYGICLMCEKEPITTFRMGECFGALGDKERAQEAFDLTFEMCRGESEYYHLQKQAEEALEKLKLN